MLPPPISGYVLWDSVGCHQIDGSLFTTDDQLQFMLVQREGEDYLLAVADSSVGTRLDCSHPRWVAVDWPHLQN